MEIDPKRSKFKKITTNYKQDNIMDIIDVEGSLSKNRFITKCDLFNFIYNEDLNRRCLNEVRENTIKLISSSSDNLVKINQNNFGIQVDELQFKTSEGLIVKLIDKYVPLKLIGQGAFGIVISAWDMRKSTKIAIKIIKKENFGSAMEKYLDNEMKIQMKLDNDRILTLFEVSDNPDYLYLFTELMEGGSLRDLIVRRYLSGDEHLFRDDECATIMRGILEGVHYMHSKNILHRDLKPDNIMLKYPNDLSSIRIADFGTATYFQIEEKSYCGTCIFMAPEMIQNKSYNESVDVWACGIILYILASGGSHPIFNKDMNTEEYVSLLLNFSEWNFTDEFPLLARNLFLKLCKFDKIHRYETLKALRHPWITRSASSSIPETLIESYKKIDMTKKFRCLLACAVFFEIFRCVNNSSFTKIKKKKSIIKIPPETKQSKVLTTKVTISSDSQVKENTDRKTSAKFYSPPAKRQSTRTSLQATASDFKLSSPTKLQKFSSINSNKLIKLESMNKQSTVNKETSSPDITKSKLRSTKYCYNSTKLNTKETIPRGQSIKTTMSQNLVSKYNI